MWNLVKLALIFNQASSGSNQLIAGSWQTITGALLVFTPVELQHGGKIAGFDLGKRSIFLRNWENPGIVSITVNRKKNGFTVKKTIHFFNKSLDGTLITTKTGYVFPKNDSDWRFWDSSVIVELRNFHHKGYKVCIFTNQLGLTVKIFFRLIEIRVNNAYSDAQKAGLDSGI